MVQAGVGCGRVREKGPASGPLTALAQRFQLHMGGLASAAGLAALLGWGAERPRPGNSEKSEGLSLLLGWPVGSCGPFPVASKVKGLYTFPRASVDLLLFSFMGNELKRIHAPEHPGFTLYKLVFLEMKICVP